MERTPLNINKQSERSFDDYMNQEPLVSSSEANGAAFDLGWRDTAVGLWARSAALSGLESRGGTKLSPEEANKRYPNLSVPFREPVHPFVAQYTFDQEEEKANLQRKIQNGPQDGWSRTKLAGAGLLSHLMDPIETGAGFLGGWAVGGAAKAGMMGTRLAQAAEVVNAGKAGLATRTAFGLAEQGVGNLVQNVALEGVATRTNEEVLYLFTGTVEVNADAESLPTPMPEPTAHERLFAVSHIVSTDANSVGGRVTVYDAETLEIAYWIETGINPDAVLSPDGMRLYIATGGIISSGGTSQTTLQAVEAVSGDEIWSVAIEHRLPWAREEGPTTLAVSYDGSRLFILGGGEASDNVIHVYDTNDGALVATIEGVTGYTAELFPSADGRSLYVVCMAGQFPPQVIDLETMTRVGVMQGFGGVITGAAASPDGRWLYIPQDFDSELSLSVIDMNGRAVSDMRSIVHMASDPLHSLNITAVSPDGSRLFIGLGSEPEGESPVADQVWVWDTANLHHDPQKIMAPKPITGWSLAPGPDNRTAFAICGDSIYRLGANEPSTIWEIFVPRDTKVLRLFSGRVTGSATPSLPETGITGLIEELTIPDDLPLGLTLSSFSSSSDFAELTFTGDDARVVQIDVRRWDGELLDPPVRSTPTHLGNLSAYVIPDPEGGWPRGVYWHDSRFVYSLSVLSSPAEGWTQDEAIAVVLAFSSPADPAATWDILRSRPLHETGMVPTPPCLRTAPQQVFDDFGPVVGDMQINGGPVYLNGPDENGAISLDGAASEDGGYYQRVMFVVGGDYTGPLLVRPSPGSGPIGFTNAAPDPSPAGEWHLTDPAGTSPTPGVRHWIVYLRFDGPGCHALQIDGLDFSSIIVFEVVAEGGV